MPEEEVKLEFLESDGKVIHTFSSKEDEKVAVKAGMNRFVWDLRCPKADANKERTLWSDYVQFPTPVG